MGTRRLGTNGRTSYGEAGEHTEGELAESEPRERDPGDLEQVAGPSAGWVLTAEPAAASRARALTRQTLSLWQVCERGDVDDIVLMVDELITNAIVHGAGPVRLRLRLQRAGHGERLVGEVTDDSPVEPRPSGVDPGGLDWSEAGRGLMLVGALAAEFGARPEGRGKTVWFTRLLQARGSNRADPAQDPVNLTGSS